MKSLILTVILATACTALGQEVTATIKQEAERCAKAMMAGDIDGVILYTHPRIVEQLGGKQAMISLLSRGISQMRTEGASFSDVTIGQAEAPQRIGSWLTCLVPEHLVMKVPGGKLYTDSNLLGISEDEGKHWVFVDLGSVRKEQLGQVFPELDGKVTVPARKPPVFKKEEGS